MDPTLRHEDVCIFYLSCAPPSHRARAALLGGMARGAVQVLPSVVVGCDGAQMRTLALTRYLRRVTWYIMCLYYIFPTGVHRDVAQSLRLEVPTNVYGPNCQTAAVQIRPKRLDLDGDVTKKSAPFRGDGFLQQH